jgi:hypothetical protein
VSLEVRCIDRVYLNAYMPKLQTSGGLCYFLREHLGHPIASPALFKPMHDPFVTAVHQFATRHEIPVVPFDSGQDKEAIVNRYRARFTRREGVVLLALPKRGCDRSRPTNDQGRGPRSPSTFRASRSPSTITCDPQKSHPGGKEGYSGAPDVDGRGQASNRSLHQGMAYHPGV